LHVAPSIVECVWSCGLKLETLTTEGFCEESSSRQLLRHHH